MSQGPRRSVVIFQRACIGCWHRPGSFVAANIRHEKVKRMLLSWSFHSNEGKQLKEERDGKRGPDGTRAATGPRLGTSPSLGFSHMAGGAEEDRVSENRKDKQSEPCAFPRQSLAPARAKVPGQVASWCAGTAGGSRGAGGH